MPVPQSVSDLDTNPNNNSPQPNEPVGPNANAYFQALGAFIKQIYTGTVKPTAAVDFNAQKITNLANGSTTSTSKDAITGAQARALAFKVGDIKMWHGAAANIASVHGPGWQLADGTNGTANLLDRFIVAAGAFYAPNATGGSSTQSLSVANLPVHNHGVNDPGHVHGVTDPGHIHAVSDPGHAHLTPFNGQTQTVGATSFQGNLNVATGASTAAAFTGIGINSHVTGIAIQLSATGITTQNTGSGTPIDTRPMYYALCFIEYTGIGA